MPDAFYQLKELLTLLLPFSADALHVHIGMALFLVVLALARGHLRRYLVAFGTVLCICLVGEVLDAFHDIGQGNAIRWRNSIKDIVDTALWPGVWAVLASRLARRGDTTAAEQQATPERRARPALSGQPR